jgi:hypothetical protein
MPLNSILSHQKRKNMRWNIKKQLRSTKKMTDSSSQTLTPPLAQEKPSLVLYRSIYDLPLSRFIDAHVDGNLYALVISGVPTEIDLLEAWQDINLQYADTMKNKEYRAITILHAEIAREEILYNQILMLLQELKYWYHDRLKNALNRLLRTRYSLDVSNPEEYDKELGNASNRTKGIMLNIKLKKLELETVEAKTGGERTAPDKQYFYSTLLTIQNHFKRTMRIDEISVFEFCEQIRRLNEEYDQLKSANK